MSQVRICSCPEPAAQRLDEPMHTHQGCLVYHTGATCAIGGITMSGNGQDVVDVPALSIGLRVTSAAIKETDGGAATAVVTISGNAKGLVKMVGEQVNVKTAGGRAHHGELRQVTVKAGKTQGGPRTITGKVAGAANMVDLVGLQVEVEEAEPNLPETGRKSRGKDASAGD
jgi:hypothetical protein